MTPSLHIRSVHIASRKSRSSSPYHKKKVDDEVSCSSQVTFDFSTTSSTKSDQTCDYPASSLTRMLTGGHASLTYADLGHHSKYRAQQQAKERKTAKPKRSSCLSKKNNNECEVLDFMTPFSRQPSKKSLYEDDSDDFRGKEEPSASAQKQEQAESKSTSSLLPALYSNDDDEEDGPELPTCTATTIPDPLSLSSMESDGQQRQLRTNSLYNDTDEEDSIFEAIADRTEKETSPWSSRSTSPSSVERTEAVVLGKEIISRSFSSQMSELSDIQEWPTGDEFRCTMPPGDALPLLVRAQRRSALRESSDSLWEKRRQVRAARLDRAKERMLREQELRAEEAGRNQLLEKTDSMMQAKHVHLTYEWYRCCGQPTQDQFLQVLPV